MKLNRNIRIIPATAWVLVLLLGCGESGPVDPPDTTPPARVTSLSVDKTTNSSALLKWIATGDDSITGNVSAYDIRYSLLPDSSETWWDSLTVKIFDGRTPKVSGQTEVLLVDGLLPDTLYYFGLIALDEAGNRSALSNVDSATTDRDPLLTLSPDTLDFDTTQSEQIITISNRGGGVLGWTVVTDQAWIQVDPAAGGTIAENDTVTVTLNRTGLAAGDYSGTVTVIPDNGIPGEVFIRMVEAERPVLVIDIVSLDFGTAETGQNLLIRNAGNAPLLWSAIDDQSWITASPVAGNIGIDNEDEIVITVERAGLAAGFHSGTITVLPEAGSPQDVEIVMTVWIPPPTVLVPAGTFIMGDGLAHGGVDERPVTLTGDFYIGKYEVTNREYCDALQWAYDNGLITVSSNAIRDRLDGSSELLVDLKDPDCGISFSGEAFTIDPGRENHPVTEVSWYGAVAYCDWLSMILGYTREYDHLSWQCSGGDPYGAAGYRIPTDAEWEYAAQYSDERIYPWGDAPPDPGRANYGYDIGWTTVTGSYPAAPASLSLYDMAGNAWEWCNDWHILDLGTVEETNPVGPESGMYRVLRGGAWGYEADNVRCSFRSGVVPSVTGSYGGFRIARSRWN